MHKDVGKLRAVRKGQNTLQLLQRNIESQNNQKRLFVFNVIRKVRKGLGTGYDTQLEQVRNKGGQHKESQKVITVRTVREN